jgi:hypothetical protein
MVLQAYTIIGAALDGNTDALRRARACLEVLGAHLSQPAGDA